MPLTFKDRLGMRMRKVPVKPIQSALEAAEAGGLSVTAATLEAHYLASGDPEKVVKATLLARRNGIPAEFVTVSAFDLAGRDPVATVEACLERQRYAFDTFEPEGTEEIVGFTRDGSETAARCEVTYRPPLQHVFGWTPAGLHRHLSARIAIFINTAADARALQMRRPEHEAKLLMVAKNLVETVERVDLTYDVRGHAR